MNAILSVIVQTVYIRVGWCNYDWNCGGATGCIAAWQPTLCPGAAMVSSPCNSSITPDRYRLAASPTTPAIRTAVPPPLTSSCYHGFEIIPPTSSMAHSYTHTHTWNVSTRIEFLIYPLIYASDAVPPPLLTTLPPLMVNNSYLMVPVDVLTEFGLVILVVLLG